MVKWGAWLCVFALSVPAYARLNIKITQGMIAGIPIAVTTSHYQEEGKGYESASFDELAGVIRHDLSISGRFAPLFLEQMPQLLSAQQEKNGATWQSVGAENVVLGAVIPAGNGYFTVHFQLLDVYKETQHQGQARVLTAQTFHHVQHKDFRHLAHHISDLVYEKLTGIRGAFSTRIAYVMITDTAEGKRYHLEVADADGYNPVTLVFSKEPIMSPSWSPDGKQLAFVSFERNRAEIYIIEVATGQRQLLSRFPGINGAPAWSPDKQWLALVLSKDGSPKLYLMEMATKKLTQLTQGYSIDTEPTWTKDGRFLYFTSNRGGKPQIYKMKLASRSIERVTFEGDYNASPMLTFDERHLVMMHRRERGGNFHIATQDLKTGQVNVLTHARLDESPTLSPNGAMVLYGTQEGGRQILGLVTLDGRGHLRFPAREGSVQEPAWSPFLS